MDAATIIKTAKTAAKVAKKMKELYELDQKKRIIFNADFYAGRFRETVSINGQERTVPDFWCEDFEIKDRRMTIFATGDRDPFCDGSSLSPERIGSIDMLKPAAGHDAIYQHQEEMAREWGWTEEDVMALADAAHANGLGYEAERQSNAVMRVLGHAVERIAYLATRTFGGIYHRSHKAALAVTAALILLGGGCVDIPQVFDPSDERPDVTVTTAEAEGAGSWDGGKSPANGRQISDSADAVDFAALSWDYGGFNGKSAALADGCRICDLRVTASGMSYHWAEGGCEQLGASDRGDYSRTLACLFVRGADGAWRGGKFDWISTSRTSRGRGYIERGEHGWPTDAIETAQGYAFVIVSKDGRKRSNVITAER